MFKQKKSIGCLLLIGIVALVVAKPIIRGFQFCTPRDEIFQVIKSNMASWQQYFENMTEDDPPVQRFTISGDSFVVFTSPDDTKDSSRLFIPVIPMRNEVLGDSGYIYSSSPSPLTDWRYDIRFISDNIYCYEFK